MPLYFPQCNATFIHIPKNAGNSLEKWAVDHQIAFEDQSNHCTLADAKLLWPDLGHVFSFVRNPFSRTVSMYHYLGQHAERKILERKSVNISDDIKTVTLYKRGFDYWLNALYDTNSEFNEKTFIGYINGDSVWPRRATQCSWFVGGTLDTYIKIENLDTEFDKVRSILNCDSSDPVAVVNPSVHDHYSQYYNSQNISIIRNMFKDDLDAFNYDF